MAPAAEKPTLAEAPNNKSSTKLLRRPRAPKPAPASSPPPQRPYHNDGGGGVHSSNPQYAPYPPSYLSDPSDVGGSLSPPPPTESHSRPRSEVLNNSRSGMSTRKSQRAVKREERRYMLDPLYRERTCIGTYVEGQTLVKPLRTRGPAPLPCRLPRQNPQIQLVPFDEDDVKYIPTPAFTLQDFTRQLSVREKVPLERVQTTVFSRYTYKRLQKLLVERCIPTYGEVTTIDLDINESDLPSVSPRIPHHQLLLEMAALVKEQMAGVVSDAELMRSVIRPLPRYSPDYKPDSRHPHTEILLYEDRSQDQQRALSAHRQEGELPGHDNIFHGGPPRYFQGSRRSDSPFAAADEGLITPSELALLDAIMCGGTALSLKAHFISELPDIEPLSQTVTYLNLSFNDFKVIPPEVFVLAQLTVLKLRNNPLSDLSEDIGLLTNLRTLVASFCLVKALPHSLFGLKKLEQLDVAYNKLSFLPQDFIKLRRLREVNVEGNQLPALPAATLRLPRLKYVRLRNNFMHPLFWEENSANQPQRLMDMAAQTIRHHDLDKDNTRLPDHIAGFLKRHTPCDLCRGALFGPGLRVIRPVSRIFNIRNVPFMFHVCSARCYDMLVNNAESLSELLYGEATGKEEPQRGCETEQPQGEEEKTTEQPLAIEQGV